MAISINLLHEEQQQELERKKDPFKLGMLLVLLVAIGLAGFYFMKAGKWGGIRNELSALESDWARKEKLQAEAVGKQAEMEGVIAEANALETFAESRFYWAPYLALIHQTVGEEASLKSFFGSVDQTGNVASNIEGVIVGASPRQSAETLRRALQTRLSTVYADVSANFTALEEESQGYVFRGSQTPAAKFVINISFEALQKRGGAAAEGTEAQ